MKDGKNDSGQWQLVYEAEAQVGEMPVWVPEQNALYFADILGCTVNRLDVATRERTSWTLPDVVGTYALSEDLKHAMVAVRHQLYWLDLADGSARTVAIAEGLDPANYQLNDGRCDRAGRFWIGSARSVGSDAPDGGAAWYSLDSDGFRQRFTGTTIANGLSWSPDNKTMYVADRPNWRVLAFDYDIETGTASQRRTFVETPVGAIPDGAVIDAQGGYWIALFGAGKVLRFLPDGTLDREISTPVTHPTMPCLGGPEGKTLYITTARYRADIESEPTAGAIYATEVDVPGLPEPRLGAALARWAAQTG